MLLSECDHGFLLQHDQLHVKDEGGVGGDGTLPARSIPLIVFNCKIQPGQDYIKLKNFIVSHPMSEEMVSLALCPFDILAMPSSHPAITSFLPDITKYQTLMFSGVADSLDPGKTQSFQFSSWEGSICEIELCQAGANADSPRVNWKGLPRSLELSTFLPFSKVST